MIMFSTTLSDSIKNSFFSQIQDWCQGAFLTIRFETFEPLSILLNITKELISWSIPDVARLYVLIYDGKRTILRIF